MPKHFRIFENPYLHNMKKTTQLAQRFREVILNGTWVANTNYKHQLSDLDWKTANTHLATLNSIAALAQHIHYYIAGVNQALQGGSLDIRDQYSFDFPLIVSQQEWETFLEKLWADAETFASLVEALPDERLEDYFVSEKYGTYQRNIDGMMEHCYYHLGQIVLIRKLLSGGHYRR